MEKEHHITEKKRTWTKKKIFSVAAAVTLLLCLTVGGTIAYLMDKTDTVVNTFTYGDINITLKETDTLLDKDKDPNTNQYEMMPGETIAKDPTLSVLKGSKDCWLFVKLEKSENFDEFMKYEMANGWIQLKDEQGDLVEGVFYRMVDAKDAEEKDVTFAVLQNNQVTVNASVTKEQLEALEKEEPPVYPTLSVTAYAVQRSENQEAIDTALDAWKLTE